MKNGLKYQSINNNPKNLISILIPLRTVTVIKNPNEIIIVILFKIMTTLIKPEKAKAEKSIRKIHLLF